jgi:hypothetical protein
MRNLLWICLVGGALGLAGCGKEGTDHAGSAAELEASADGATTEQAAESEAPEEPGADDTTTASNVEGSLREAQRRLQAGEFDTAAADLLRMQMESRDFSDDHAATYRELLSQTMTAAVAAADKGDPRGQAALQMLRAARRR